MLNMFKNTEKVLGVFTVIFRTIAIVVGLIALISAGNTLFFTLTSESAQGEVVDFAEVVNPAPVVNPGGTSISYRARIEFPTRDGQAVQFEGRSSRGDEQFDLGDTVPVRYRPANPQGARIDTTLEIWATPLIFGGLFLVFAILGIVAPFAFSDHRAHRSSTSPVWPESKKESE